MPSYGGQALLRRAGRTTAKDQGNGRVKGAHLKVAATESTAEAIEATGRRRYERQRRTGRIPSYGGQACATKSTVTAAAMWKSEGAAARPFDPSPRDLRMNCSRAAGAIHKHRPCQN